MGRPGYEASILSDTVWPQKSNSGSEGMFINSIDSCFIVTSGYPLTLVISFIKSGLRRVRNCVGEQVVCLEIVASSYVFILTIAMQIVYTVILHVALWLQVCCTVSGQSCPTKGIPYSIIHRPVATQFS